jgi:hypothetical protein
MSLVASRICVVDGYVNAHQEATIVKEPAVIIEWFSGVRINLSLIGLEGRTVVAVKMSFRVIFRGFGLKVGSTMPYPKFICCAILRTSLQSVLTGMV